MFSRDGSSWAAAATDADRWRRTPRLGPRATVSVPEKVRALEAAKNFGGPLGGGCRDYQIRSASDERCIRGCRFGWSAEKFRALGSAGFPAFFAMRKNFAKGFDSLTMPVVYSRPRRGGNELIGTPHAL